MEITLQVPDAFAQALIPANGDPARTALEAVGIEAYRQRRITSYQLRTLLGIDSRFGFYEFLKQHRVETYCVEDLEHDMARIGGAHITSPA